MVSCNTIQTRQQKKNRSGTRVYFPCWFVLRIDSLPSQTATYPLEWSKVVHYAGEFWGCTQGLLSHAKLLIWMWMVFEWILPPLQMSLLEEDDFSFSPHSGDYLSYPQWLNAVCCSPHHCIVSPPRLTVTLTFKTTTALQNTPWRCITIISNQYHV